MRNRQYLGCLHVRDGILTLEQLYFADEVDPPETILPGKLPRVEKRPREAQRVTPQRGGADERGAAGAGTQARDRGTLEDVEGATREGSSLCKVTPDEAIDELYGAELESFIGERKRLVRKLKESG